MKFEWDEEKNNENIGKHGLDFADAWQIFEAPMLTALDTKEDYGEDRVIDLRSLRNFVVVVVYNTQPQEETTRIASLRKARKHECAQFEEALHHQLGEG